MDATPFKGMQSLEDDCIAPASHKNRNTRSRPIMANVDRAYNLVRHELAELGLLADGVYLDAIELCISNAKSSGERGYVFEQVGHYAKRGYRPGVIYLPRDLPHQPYKPGMTLCDTIRHEYAHAWYYIDSGFFKQDWFERTFGAAYNNCASTPYQSWRRHLKRDPNYQAGKRRRSSEQGTEILIWLSFSAVHHGLCVDERERRFCRDLYVFLEIPTIAVAIPQSARRLQQAENG